MIKDPFRNDLAKNVFHQKYAQGSSDSWDNLAERLVDHVCGVGYGFSHPILSKSERDQLKKYIKEMKFLPGGRYLYYAGRPNRYFNNCFLLRAEEDTREEWSNLLWRASSCLLTGGGIGIDYSRLRPSGRILSRTGGLSSGPISLMQMVNEVGRGIMQGGSRRSAIYASLNWQHEDIEEFLTVKDWHKRMVGESGLTLADIKAQDFNFPAPLDMTNISVNYDDEWLKNPLNSVFLANCKQAMMTGEPGFSFNFGDKENETLRNAPVAGDTLVLTKEGYRRVLDLHEEDVYVWTGKQYARTTFVKTKSMTETIRVNMTGGRFIVCDPEHPFLVEKWVGKGKYRNLASIDRIEAQTLASGDILHVSLPEVKPEPFFSEDYTLGYLYGDGSFRKEGGGEITLCSDASKELLPHFNHTWFSSINYNDSRGHIRCYVKASAIEYSSKAVYPLFEDGITPSFLAGLFDADGSYDEKQHRIRLASVHKSFLEGAQRHLESLGILASITKGGISTYGQKEGWLLVVMSDYINKFIDLIPTKRIKPQKHDSYRKSHIKVVSIQTDKTQDVYCCDVGVEEHAFMAEGVIVSNCTEVTSEDDSDVCNLGSLNLGNISSLDEFKDVCALASKFLVCGTVRADLPYDKVKTVREKNRRLGLGLMGIHEWLLKKGYPYEVVPELKQWLEVYRDESERSANEHCDRLYLSRPVAYRAIAPTGSIGILAGTTTGIEPLFAVAYKRRYLTDGTRWKYEYVVDHTAETLIREHGVNPDNIETAYSLSGDYEKRIRFQADVQDYVDMSISSTINLPAWGSKDNNESHVEGFATLLAKYAPRLRGFTCYPDGSRGGQPITEIPYSEAIGHKGVVYEENDSCKGGVCGL